MQTYSAEEPPPPPEEREFPMEVRHKKAASVVIYEVRNREKAMYTIAYPFDGRRRRQMRREFDTAFSLAKEIALKMADGALNVLALEGRERFVYQRALELSTSVQLDLDVLVSRAVEAANIPVPAIGAFAGLRSEEIKRLQWPARHWHSWTQKQWRDLTPSKGQTSRVQSTLGKGSPSARRWRPRAARSRLTRPWRWMPSDSSVSAKTSGWARASARGV
jgi:hypothetical protein